jgi:hypothetical protein
VLAGKVEQTAHPVSDRFRRHRPAVRTREHEALAPPAAQPMLAEHAADLLGEGTLRRLLGLFGATNAPPSFGSYERRTDRRPAPRSMALDSKAKISPSPQTGVPGQGHERPVLRPREGGHADGHLGRGDGGVPAAPAGPGGAGLGPGAAGFSRDCLPGFILGQGGYSKEPLRSP